jgi:integrase
MKGHIRQRSAGSWELRYRAAGKTHTATFRGTKTDANKELRRLLGLVDTGQHATSGTMTLGAWLDRWLGFCDEEKAGHSADRYRFMVEAYISPGIGHHRLDRLTPGIISAFYSAVKGRRGGPLGPRTRQQIHTCLSSALKRAVKLRLIAFNPATACADQLPRHEREEMTVLTVEQSRQLLEAATGSPLYAPILIALATGARRGECLGLRWANVDLDRGLIRITEQLEERQGRGIRSKLPKREKVRSVTLAPAHVEMMRRLKMQQAEHFLAFGVRQSPDMLVCALPDGSTPSPRALSGQFPRFVRKVPGLPPITFHDLRHTHATIGLEAGVAAKVMQERLGHSSITLTMDLYSHCTETMQEQAAAKLDEVWR